mgnify:CR=1 FL=1
MGNKRIILSSSLPCGLEVLLFLLVKRVSYQSHGKTNNQTTQPTYGKTIVLGVLDCFRIRLLPDIPGHDSPNRNFKFKGYLKNQAWAIEPLSLVFWALASLAPLVQGSKNPMVHGYSNKAPQALDNPF